MGQKLNNHIGQQAVLLANCYEMIDSLELKIKELTAELETRNLQLAALTSDVKTEMK